ncbi:MAG: tetratricopeptide repeat protein [Magnetococcales bacterium]|nr:tetratricopeptide repeat protein [Magnetococcales bacterium]
MSRSSFLPTLLVALTPLGMFSGGCADNRLAPDREAEFAALLTKGQAYMERRKPQQALPALRQAQRIRPDSPELLTTLAKAYSQLGQTRAALDVLEQAHALRPKDPTILHNLAVAALDEGNLDQAEAMLLEVTTRPEFDNQANAWHNLAIVHRKRNNPQKMVEALESALRADPSHLLSHRSLAAFHEQSGRFELERPHLEKIVALDPDNIEILERLGQNLLQQGLAEQARPIFKRLIQRDPNHPAAQRAHARLLEIEQP